MMSSIDIADVKHFKMEGGSLVANPYKTIVIATLEQQSGLAIGGGDSSNTAMCYRDGQGRLALPGTGLGGLLVESACRLFPQVVDDEEGVFLVSGKSKQLPSQGSQQDAELRRSTWYIHTAYPISSNVTTYWQQGLGIDHKTRVSAAETNALYEQELIPRGTRWKFILEIDTANCPRAEWLAILTLKQWSDGWAMLGRSPTRGNGRFVLCEGTVFPLSYDAMDEWPCNRFDLSSQAGVKEAKDHLGKQCKSISYDDCFKGVLQKLDKLQKLDSDDKRNSSVLTLKPWYYARVSFDLHFGCGSRPHLTKDTPKYGLNTLTVSGHEQLQTINLATYPDHIPASARSEADSPFSAALDNDTWKPMVSGGGARGPIRHIVSALARGKGGYVPDPNNAKERRKWQDESSPSTDPITNLFGWPTLSDDENPSSSRLLVWDSWIEKSHIVRTEHHAEDEFTAGTFASAKFNRDTLIEGSLTLVLQFEAEQVSDLLEDLRVLLPALRYAQLGYVGIGGKKSVSGHTPWRFSKTHCADALGRTNEEVMSEISHLLKM